MNIYEFEQALETDFFLNEMIYHRTIQYYEAIQQVSIKIRIEDKGAGGKGTKLEMSASYDIQDEDEALTKFLSRIRTKFWKQEYR